MHKYVVEMFKSTRQKNNDDEFTIYQDLIGEISIELDKKEIQLEVLEVKMNNTLVTAQKCNCTP